MRFQGRRAVVTGGASGIGEATARLFAAEGARVAVLDLKASGEDAYACDVSDEKQAGGAIEEIARKWGGVDILANCAGIAIRRPVAEESAGEWDRIMGVNVRGTFLCCRHVLPHMSRGAAIVHVSSVTGITGVRNRAAYSTSKGAIVALTRNMAMDLAGEGIRVNCVCPGFVDTPLLAGLRQFPERLERIRSLHPLGRLGDSRDVAEAIAFLASDAAAWITGVTLPVDGGFSAGLDADI